MKCKKCGHEKPASEFYQKGFGSRTWTTHSCKECVKDYERVRQRTWYKDEHREAQKRYHRKLKHELISAYGGKCVCCGEGRWEFLQLDHVNGGGRKHRLALTVHMSLHLKQIGYPKDSFRLLCANCNSSIGLYGYCPHKSEDNN